MLDEYAYVVVGGGSSGALLARLLARLGNGRVALLEAGSRRRDIRTVVPALYPKTFASNLDWGFSTQPQVMLNGRRLAWPRGKTLGGCGAINALIYLQAAASDFDRWAAASCPGWDWRSITAWRLSAASFFVHDTEPSPATTTCPFSGLPLAPLSQPHPWSEAFLQSAQNWGLKLDFPWLQAASGRCGLYQLTQRNGRRQHTASELTERCPESLTILCDHTAERLELGGGRVRTIVCRGSDETPVQLNVQGQVILAAGTIGSPKLLLQSGIGPAELLRSYGLDVQLDLPGVGENLQDHLVYPLIYQMRCPEGQPSRFDRIARDAYRQYGRGPLASNLAEAGAQWSLDGGSSPDFQIHFTTTHYLKYPRLADSSEYCSLAVTDLHPRSRGRLGLIQAPDGWQPYLDPGYLSVDDDVQRLTHGLHQARQFVALPGLKELVKSEVLPGDKRWTTDALQRSLRMLALSIYHPVGTCRMGTDALAVVDPDLQLHGCENLHVADASILPDLPSANTNAVTLMIAAIKAWKLLRTAT